MNKSSSNDDHFKELDQILLTEGVIKSSCEEADESNKIQINFESSHEVNVLDKSKSSISRINLEKENGDILSISFDNSEKFKQKSWQSQHIESFKRNNFASSPSLVNNNSNFIHQTKFIEDQKF